MQNIIFENDVFNINGHETFLFGGEIHYFRIPREQWEDRIIKAKEAGCNLISTYIPWLIHEDIEGDIDFEGFRKPENALGAFIDIAQKHGMYVIVRPGPYIMSEIKNEGLPFWIYDKYPDLIAKNKAGENHCTRVAYYMHKGFLSEVDRWYKAIGNVIKPRNLENGGPVIMAQIDNEIGMLHWVTNQADCTPENIEKFKAWLLKKYGGLTQVKEAYRELDLENDFYKGVCQPTEQYAKKLRVDFAYYTREYFKEYFNTLKEMFLKYTGEMLAIVNVHGYTTIDIAKRGKDYPIGLSQLADVPECKDTIMAGDYYIGNIAYDNMQDIMLSNAMTYAVQPKGQPLFSAEFQGGFQVDCPKFQPTTFDLTTRLCVANGMNALNYYMFCGGKNVPGTDLLGIRHSWQAPVDWDGNLKPHYKVISHIGHILKAVEKPLLQTKQEAVVHLGFIPENYMTEYSDCYTSWICDEMRTFRDAMLFDGMGKGMTVNNIIFEGYNVTKNKDIDVQKVPSLAVFTTRFMTEENQQKLLRYVENGGKLLIFPTLPEFNLEGEACTILLDALGVNIIGDRWHNFVKYIDDVENCTTTRSTFFSETSGVFARHEGNDANVGFEKTYGKGKIVVFGVGMTHDYNYKNDVILNLFKKIDVQPLYTSDDVLQIISRKDKNGGRFLFINNIDEYEKKTKIYYQGQALLNGKDLVIQSRKGLLITLNIKIHTDIFIEYSTCEIYEINEQNGVTVTVVPSQPQDEIILRTNRKIENSDRL